MKITLLAGLPWLAFITVCYFLFPRAGASYRRERTISMDELLKWRGQFPILETTTYMISNSLGAMPRGVYNQLHDYAETWATRGVRAWEEGWWEMAVSQPATKLAPSSARSPAKFPCTKMSPSPRPSFLPASIFQGRAIKL